MNKEFFDWEQDSELSTNGKIINMPISVDERAKRIFKDLEDGYEYSDSGMLYKIVNLKENIIYYDPATLQLDEHGRKYFFDDDYNRIYIDDFGNIYNIRCDINGQNLQEYIVIGRNKLLIFLDASHTVGVTEDGNVYEYNTEKKCYCHNPNIVLHPDAKSKL